MYRNDSGAKSLSRGPLLLCSLINDLHERSAFQEIHRANTSVKIAADLAVKYHKNVQYNIEATRGNDLEA